MDPLSIAASVVGLLAAAGKVTSILTTLLRSTKDAPKFAQNILREVSDISATLAQLQALLLGTRAGQRSRMEMVMVEQVVVTLTTCVLTFSELEDIVTSLQHDQLDDVGTRLRWAKKEAVLTKLLGRLHSSQLSLNLMLTTLTCASIDEARTSVDILTTVVHQVLQSNQDILSRIGGLEGQSQRHRDSTISGSTSAVDDGASTIRPERITEPRATDMEDTSFTFSFDEDLSSSRVYSRARRRESAESLRSSAAFSFGWSCLSDFSLGSVSNVSVISLPVDISEISNGRHYRSVPQAELGGTINALSTTHAAITKTVKITESVEGSGIDENPASLISSSPSIEDDDIDFEFAYTLHTFIATVEDQISVTKGDVLILLDDSNSYWWLVRSVKDGCVGHLPAENIEMPVERLARLNKHRNLDLLVAMPSDPLLDNNAKAMTRTHALRLPVRKRIGKSVQFTAPTFIDSHLYSSDEAGYTQETRVEKLKFF